MERLTPLLLWLETQGASGMSNNDVDFRYSRESGLGCFAMHDFDVNDVIFKIPRKCIIGHPSSSSSPLCHTIESLLDPSSEIDASQFTCEFSIFLFVLQQLSDVNSFFYPYVSSLDQPDSPSILSWSDGLLSCFQGTNLASSIKKTQTNLSEKSEFIRVLLNHMKQTKADDATANNTQLLETIDYKRLAWIWGHYLSRRYPGYFSRQNLESSIPSIDSDIRGRFEQFREKELGNLGSLVPLLDILNHNYDHDWLRFEHDSEFLVVICNHSVKKVQ